VYSELARGTTFKVYFPWVERASDVAPLVPPQEAEPGGSEVILLVEDEEMLRSMIRESLVASGYTVLTAANGVAALAVAAGHEGRIDLLLTDAVMPVMGGKDLSVRLAATRPEVKALYMSGYTEDAVVRHGVLRAQVDFIQKPFSPEALARKVREVLDAKAREPLP